MIVLEILLYLILFLLAIILLILALPIYYASSGQRFERTFLAVRVYGPMRWFSFIYSMQGIGSREIRVRIFGIKVNIKGKRTKEEESEGKKERKEKKKKKRHEKGYIKKILDMAGDFLKHVKPRVIIAEGRYGFDDPYYTGLTCAILNCISIRSSRYKIKLTPVFEEEVYEGRYEVKGRVIPIFLMWICLKTFTIPGLISKISSVGKRKVQKSRFGRSSNNITRQQMSPPL